MMKALLALVGLLFFAQAYAVETKKVCYENHGIYVANVKFKIWNTVTHTLVREKEYRRIWNTEYMKCVEYLSGDDRDPQAQWVEIDVERYMFLGNATLRHTCNEYVAQGSAIIWSDGTTIKANCGVDPF